jgi:ParB-like chromosome segregation protein Spo0J
MVSSGNPWKTSWCILGLAVVLAGCNRWSDARYQSGLAEAEKRINASDLEGAVRVYESLLDGSPKTVEAHYRLAVLYADRLKNPLGAQHHFLRYLAIAPEGAYAKEARAWEKEGHSRLLTYLSNGAPLTQEEAARLKNENLSLKKSLFELRAAKSAPVAGAAAGKGGDLGKKPIPPGAKTHTVGRGETLASIAVKYYKNKARYKDILNANFYSAEAATKLQVGQELIIP